MIGCYLIQKDAPEYLLNSKQAKPLTMLPMGQLLVFDVFFESGVVGACSDC